MALKIVDHGSPEYRQMLKLRDDILRKPLGLSFDEDELEGEKDNLLIAAFEDDEMLGCCIGRALMQFAENLARDRGYKVLTMHARNNAIGFYEKMGYRKKGEEFLEVTISHYVMEKEL
jgi:GNAT superfamily N-acetyltransferase